MPEILKMPIFVTQLNFKVSKFIDKLQTKCAQIKLKSQKTCAQNRYKNTGCKGFCAMERPRSWKVGDTCSCVFDLNKMSKNRLIFQFNELCMLWPTEAIEYLLVLIAPQNIKIGRFFRFSTIFYICHLVLGQCRNRIHSLSFFAFFYLKASEIWLHCKSIQISTEAFTNRNHFQTSEGNTNLHVWSCHPCHHA
jgi:hypothetical protein